MNKSFWLEDICADPSRNLIIRDGQPYALPPKTLEVLLYLAQRPGQVLSQDLILQDVWPGRIVSNNSLQRCITQLRKALGDNGKHQRMIKTHSKRGYSLEVPVYWEAPSHDAPKMSGDNQQDCSAQIVEPNLDTITSNRSDKTKQSAWQTYKLKSVYTAAIVGLLLFAIYFMNGLFKGGFTERAGELVFSIMQPLTSSDAKEFDANYSPDGQYAVFHRYTGQCVNNLWVKDLATEKEWSLTNDFGRYGSHSFSPDGEKLVFLAREECGEKPLINTCFHLMTLNFKAALSEPQSPETLLSCSDAKLSSPHWLKDSSVVFLQSKAGESSQIIKYIPEQNITINLYKPTNKRLLHLSYSIDHNLMAAIAIDQNNQYVLELLEPSGQVLSSSPLSWPSSNPLRQAIYPRFDPGKEQLLFSTGTQLFTLSFYGQIKPVTVALNQHLYQPLLHPDGQRLLASHGVVDGDIALLDLIDSTQPSSEIFSDKSKNSVFLNQPHPSFERSIYDDADAIFQPNGDMIAFSSLRSGTRQIWLHHKESSWPVTQFNRDSHINGFSWHPEIEWLLIAANGQLYRMDVDGNYLTIESAGIVTQLMGWVSEDIALLSELFQGEEQLVLFNLKTQARKIIVEQAVLWAEQLVNGDVIFQDDQYQIWRHPKGSIEAYKIERLSGMNDARRFTAEANTLYGISDDAQLWSYEVDIEQFQYHRRVSHLVNYISDKRDDPILVKQAISAKKEVIELIAPD